DHVVDTDLGTTIAAGAARVHTVEHVMASVAALGIDNVLIDLDGPEAPIRDGSFQEYVAALDEAGPISQGEPARVLVVRGTVRTSGPNGQSYVAEPASGLHIAASIEFEHPAIGRQHGSFAIAETTFRSDLAPARTFGFMSDAEA